MQSKTHVLCSSYNTPSKCGIVVQATNCDMAATWRGCAKGGGAKVHKFPCHCCSVINEELIQKNEHMCARYCQDHHADNDEWKCYHRSIEDDRNLADWMTELRELRSKLLVDLEPVGNSLMSCGKSDNPVADPNSIEYEPQTRAEKGMLVASPIQPSKQYY
jgi:hypothetical protein